jgi:hypothetical protein
MIPYRGRRNLEHGSKHSHIAEGKYSEHRKNLEINKAVTDEEADAFSWNRVNVSHTQLWHCGPWTASTQPDTLRQP